MNAPSAAVFLSSDCSVQPSCGGVGVDGSVSRRELRKEEKEKEDDMDFFVINSLGQGEVCDAPPPVVKILIWHVHLI